MLRLLIALFWVSLIIGTLVAHSVVANWAVTLAALYFTARWWAGRRRTARTSVTAAQPTPMAVAVAPAPTGNAADPSTARPVRSRWTIDRVHSAQRPWR
jgi:hypothetical protein